MNNFLARQGDVLILGVSVNHHAYREGVATLPHSHEDGRVVLAHGEVTGHAHAIATDNPGGAPTAILHGTDEAKDRYLTVSPIAPQIDAWHIRTAWGDAYVPADQEPACYAGYVETLGRVLITGVVLRHEEHLPVVLPYGRYIVRRQREYTPEASIVVAD